jgi:hypothetical protein
MNMLELSNTLGIAKTTIAEYVFILENTYIIKKINPFHKNVRSELTKMPKIYFEDTGLANILINKTFSQNIDGYLFETSVYSELRKNTDVENLYFWRTIGKHEVDFVIDDVKRNKLFAIETKCTFHPKGLKHLFTFETEYKDAEISFCCLNKNNTEKVRHADIYYPWELIPVMR